MSSASPPSNQLPIVLVDSPSRLQEITNILHSPEILSDSSSVFGIDAEWSSDTKLELVQLCVTNPKKTVQQEDFVVYIFDITVLNQPSAVKSLLEPILTSRSLKLVFDGRRDALMLKNCLNVNISAATNIADLQALEITTRSATKEEHDDDVGRAVGRNEARANGGALYSKCFKLRGLEGMVGEFLEKTSSLLSKKVPLAISEGQVFKARPLREEILRYAARDAAVLEPLMQALVAERKITLSHEVFVATTKYLAFDLTSQVPSEYRNHGWLPLGILPIAVEEGATSCDLCHRFVARYQRNLTKASMCQVCRLVKRYGERQAQFRRSEEDRWYEGYESGDSW